MVMIVVLEPISVPPGTLSIEALVEALRCLGGKVVALADDLAAESAFAIGVQPPAVPIRRMVFDAINIRRRRGALFGEELFSDPAWEILLHLFLAELDQVRLTAGGLAHRANLPQTTVHRWLLVLAARTLLVKRADPLDARRMFVELHPDASLAMRQYFMQRGAIQDAS